MAQPTKIFNQTNQPIKEGVEVQKPISYNKEIDTVSIKNLLDATVKLTGTVTGQQYVFHGAGAIVVVDSRDKDEILNKKRGRACCGGQSGKAVFELVV